MSTENIILEYIPWFKEQVEGPCALVCKIFHEHCTDKVQEKAKELEIELVFIPSNGTTIYQPCYLQITRILQKMSQMEWEIARIRERNRVVWNKGSVAIVCINVFWNNISPLAIWQEWRAFSNINDPEYFVVENDSDVGESDDVSD